MKKRKHHPVDALPIKTINVLRIITKTRKVDKLYFIRIKNYKRIYFFEYKYIYILTERKNYEKIL